MSAAARHNSATWKVKANDHARQTGKRGNDRMGIASTCKRVAERTVITVLGKSAELGI